MNIFFVDSLMLIDNGIHYNHDFCEFRVIKFQKSKFYTLSLIFLRIDKFIHICHKYSNRFQTEIGYIMTIQNWNEAHVGKNPFKHSKNTCILFFCSGRASGF